MLTYSRFFAEFLEDLSLVRLGLLALNTCVGLRYGSYVVMLRSFSWKRAPPDSVRPRTPLLLLLTFTRRIFLSSTFTVVTRIHNWPGVQHSVTPIALHTSWGILTPPPSPAAVAIGLGPANPSMISIAKETLFFRRAGISPALRLLVPTFSLPSAPP